MPNNEMLSEDEITPENLVSVFRRALMSASIDDEGELYVQMNEMRIYIFVKEKAKMLRYMAAFGVKESDPFELNLALVNEMNNNIAFGRFAIPDFQRDMLIADYHLPYEQGVPRFQVISTLTLFKEVVLAAIGACIDNGLVMCQQYD